MTFYEEISQENRMSLTSKLIEGTAEYIVPVACGLLATQVDAELLSPLGTIGVIVPTIEKTSYEIMSHFQTYGYTAFTSDSTPDENRFATKILYFDACVGGVLNGAMKGTVLFAASYNLAHVLS